MSMEVHAVLTILHETHSSTNNKLTHSKHTQYFCYVLNSTTAGLERPVV